MIGFKTLALQSREFFRNYHCQMATVSALRKIKTNEILVETNFNFLSHFKHPAVVLSLVYVINTTRCIWANDLELKAASHNDGFPNIFLLFFGIVFSSFDSLCFKVSWGFELMLYDDFLKLIKLFSFSCSLYVWSAEENRWALGNRRVNV